METKREERHIGEIAKAAAREEAKRPSDRRGLLHSHETSGDDLLPLMGTSTPAPGSSLPSSKARDPKHPRSRRVGSLFSPALVLSIAALGASVFVYTSGCSLMDDKPASRKPTRSVVVPTSSAARAAAASSSADVGKTAAADAGADAADASAPYEGPYAGAIVMQAPIYSEMSPTKENLIGYMRSGARAPVEAKPIKGANCKEGWYQLIPRGYVCGRHITLEAEDPRVKLGITPPKLDQTVPYQYAYNTKNGTPLYRTVPSREQMNEYEPYLTSAVKAREREEKRRREDEEQDDAAEREEREERDMDAGAPSVAVGDNAEADAGAVPWWQRTDGGKADIKLADLSEGSDSVLARRMVKGFFVAVDRSFGWNGRLWYKTTEGLVAPADRMSINKPPSFHGVELGGQGQPKLPIGFITGPGASKWELSSDSKSFERKAKAAFHTIAALTGKSLSRGGVEYWETTDGWWMKGVQSTMTAPASMPDGIGPDEKWIDVNLTRQTLVLFEGNRPVYATLVSTGKKGATKKNDHSTVTGSFRVREKHIAATMDGDGAAPGESPYSIQDVPYILYFKGSYALHGAFWHTNFGNKMSHGCVNLSPLDAKRVFLWSEPNLPVGWHGAWASKDHPGTLVVVHD